MNLINELRMLAEDLHVKGYNRYSAAMSKAADELDKWGGPSSATLAARLTSAVTPSLLLGMNSKNELSALKARCITSVCAAKTARAVSENAAALHALYWRNRND